MDHSALKLIYVSKKPPKTNRIQKFLEELSDYSFTIEHQSGKHMFISDFLSRFSSPEIENFSIPFLTSTSSLTGKSYMSYLDRICNYNYANDSGKCSHHSYPLTRSQAKIQKVTLPDLFQKSQKSSRKISPVVRTPIPELIPDKPPPVKRWCGRPPKQLETIREYPCAEIPFNEHVQPARPLNRPRRSQTHDEIIDVQEPTPVPRIRLPDLQAISDIDGHMPSDSNEVSKLLHPTEPDFITTPPEVDERIIPVDLESQFQPLMPLSTLPFKNLKIKTRKDITKQTFIDKLLETLNHKSTHFYQLPFSLDALRKSQRLDPFYATLILYLESNHLPSNDKKQRTILAECENYILFNNLLYHFNTPSSKIAVHKVALCIPRDISHKIFELYHSGVSQLQTKR
jgi:hypothetical protein